jgi:tetratricopeptide (TPR) repeat protein
VAAVRPLLLGRLGLLLLAFDAWVTYARGGAYGLAGFNVAHFRWLDALAPLPTPGLYVGVLLLCGLLALVAALSGPSRPLVAAVFALHTFAWSISQLDLYQHHYLLSLVLFCLIFFPPLRAADALPASRAGGPGPRTCAWAFRLLGAVFALVYAWAAVAKLEPFWLAGATPAEVARAKALPQAAAELFAALGGSRQSFWALVGGGTVAVEFALAGGYLLALRQDERAGASRRRACLAAFLLAAALHLSFEAMGLLIGRFSFYMLLAAAAFLLPERWLLAPCALLLAPARHLAAVAAARGPAARGGSGRGWLAAALALAAGLALLGRWLDLPGAPAALLAAGAALLVSVALALARGEAGRARARALGFAAAGLALAAQVSLRPERHELWWSHASSLREIGDLPGALAALRKAERHVRGPDEIRGRLRADLAGAELARGALGQAIEGYREALRLFPRQPVAHNNLGAALARSGRAEEAIAHYREALRLRPRYATAQRNLERALAGAAPAGASRPEPDGPAAPAAAGYPGSR